MAKATPTVHSLKRLVDWCLAPVGSTLLVCLVLVVGNLLLTYHARGYTSDDVIWQNALLHWRPFSHNTYFGDGGVSYVIKVPFYWFVSLFLSPGRRTLLVEGTVLILGNFLLFYWCGLYFMRKLSIPRNRINLLPFVWLASFGYAITQLFMATNMHNIEIGFIFVTFVAAAKLYYGEIDFLGSWRTLALAIIGCVLVGLTIVDDRYYAYFGILPLMAAAVIWFIWARQSQNRQRALHLFGAIVVSFLFAAVIQKLLKDSGVSLAVSGDVAGAQTPQFINYGAMFNNIGTTILDMFVLYGADFWGRNVLSSLTVGTLINAGLLLGSVLASALYVLTKPHAKTGNKRAASCWPRELVFLSSLFFGVLIIYALSTLSGTGSYRYLMLLPFITVLIFTFLANRLPHNYRLIAAIILSLAIILNVHMNVAGARQPALIGPAFSDDGSQEVPNSYNYSLINFLKTQHLSKGYGSYWDANITTYLSAGQINLLPSVCSANGKTTLPFKWLIDQRQFTLPATRSFYVLDPRYPGPAICSRQAIVQQFGPPVHTLSFSGDTILVYNYDITSKLNLNASAQD